MTGQDITEAKRKLGLTWQAFAKSLGCSERTLRRYVYGETPVPEYRARIVRDMLKDAG